MRPLNLLLIDDHQIIIDGLVALLSGDPSLGEIYRALSGEAAYAVLERETVDIALLDINLPNKNGFQICKELKRDYPDLRIIALTMHSESGFVAKMVKAGADGYLLKNTGKEELLLAIQTVAQDGQYFNQEITRSLIDGMRGHGKRRTSGVIQKLTRREREILRLIVDEHTSEEIAGKLFISASTVISHRKNLLAKLNAKNTAGLVKAAMEFRLLE